MALLLSPSSATGNVTDGFITTALQETGGLPGAENIDWGDKR